MASRNPIRTVTVLRTHLLTPNMKRITVSGSELRGFPEHQESGYVKLIFANYSAETASDRQDKSQKPLMRTYTIRRHDPEALEMDIDFVVHGDNGPASAWAMQAQVGDSLTLTGPGGKKVVEMSADWFFIAGDMTALPAISINLQQMPRDARGYAVIEIIDKADRQQLQAPEGIELHWVINPHPDIPNKHLSNAVKALPWQAGKVNVWVAAEFDTMRDLRRYFKQEMAVGRSDIYASSYWKIGETDEGNKLAKRNDAEA